VRALRGQELTRTAGRRSLIAGRARGSGGRGVGAATPRGPAPHWLLTGAKAASGSSILCPLPLWLFYVQLRPRQLFPRARIPALARLPPPLPPPILSPLLFAWVLGLGDGRCCGLLLLRGLAVYAVCGIDSCVLCSSCAMGHAICDGVSPAAALSSFNQRLWGCHLGCTST
jgi:hypothetical protein